MVFEQQQKQQQQQKWGQWAGRGVKNHIEGVTLP